jgi:hypothetical protein
MTLVSEIESGVLALIFAIAQTGADDGNFILAQLQPALSEEVEIRFRNAPRQKPCAPVTLDCDGVSADDLEAARMRFLALSITFQKFVHYKNAANFASEILAQLGGATKITTHSGGQA